MHHFYDLNLLSLELTNSAASSYKPLLSNVPPYTYENWDSDYWYLITTSLTIIRYGFCHKFPIFARWGTIFLAELMQKPPDKSCVVNTLCHQIDRSIGVDLIRVVRLVKAHIRYLILYFPRGVEKDGDWPWWWTSAPCVDSPGSSA